MMKRHISFLALLLLLGLSSCSDMLNTHSDLVEFAEDNKLDTPEDSVYSVMGILHQMQKIADRTVLLGELRADLMEPTAKASADLKAIASCSVPATNPYNSISDYYAVINNCNYFLHHVDTTLRKRNRSVFAREYAAVKAFRAWTYLQAAQVYGAIPLLTDPVLTESEAREAMAKSPSDIPAICNYFISDLVPEVDTELPAYGSISAQESSRFFIPVRALLGDLCLWVGRYQEAAQYYHDYLTRQGQEIVTGTSGARWGDTSYKGVVNGYTTDIQSSSGGEVLSYIPMESSVFNGVKSGLATIYNSISENYSYFQARPSARLRELSAAEDYCMVYEGMDSHRDTIYVPKVNQLSSDAVGDLRFFASYIHRVELQGAHSRYSSDIQILRKLNNNGITTYRRTVVYLHFAEALNRAGYPQSAMAVLKYGLYPEAIDNYVDSVERKAAGTLLSFSQTVFTRNNTQGIHSRGCGDSDANAHYVLPQPETTLASRADTVNWQVPLVEDMIMRELALETAFEGCRFYDLMRVALRRGEPAYLATPVSLRAGQRDESLFQLLMTPSNWYLPKN